MSSSRPLKGAIWYSFERRKKAAGLEVYGFPILTARRPALREIPTVLGAMGGGGGFEEHCRTIGAKILQTGSPRKKIAILGLQSPGGPAERRCLYVRKLRLPGTPRGHSAASLPSLPESRARVCTGSARGLHAVCTGSARGLHAVCTGSARGLHGVCTRSARGLHGVCTGSARGPRTPPAAAPSRTWLPTPVESGQSEGRRTRRLAPLRSQHTKADFQNRGRVKAAGSPGPAPFAEGLLPRIRPRGRGFPRRRREPGRGGRRPGGSPTARSAPRQPSASRGAASCAQPKRSDLRGEHSAGPAPGETASLAAACEVWSRPTARGQSQPRAAHAQCPREERASARRAARNGIRSPGLGGGRASEFWWTPALEAKRPRRPGGRDGDRSRGGRALSQAIKTAISVGTRLRAADGFSEVPRQDRPAARRRGKGKERAESFAPGEEGAPGGGSARVAAPRVWLHSS
uniref:translation initiation factor IF-2-like n=1 Tax=Callithrix jacchus TaxID=9483 RepID=UPI0023DD2C8E|nr:translation initiation factor IF-2-like [Callithrix jacchus]